MTPELATIAQIGLKAERYDPGPIDGIWGTKSATAFRHWAEDRFGRQVDVGVPAWLAIARKEIGITEIAGKQHNPRILDYHARTKLHAADDETAWCSSFACWCLEEAGLASPRSAWARDWLNWGKSVVLQVGAIAVFRRGAHSGHVGFVEAWDATRIWVLGGNQSNRVCVAPYPRTDVLGVRMPK